MKNLLAQAVCAAVLATSAIAVFVAGPLTSRPAVALADWLLQSVF